MVGGVRDVACGLKVSSEASMAFMWWHRNTWELVLSLLSYTWALSGALCYWAALKLGGALGQGHSQYLISLPSRLQFPAEKVGKWLSWVWRLTLQQPWEQRVPGARVQGLREGTRRREELEGSEGEEGLRCKMPLSSLWHICTYQGWSDRGVPRPSLGEGLGVCRVLVFVSQARGLRLQRAKEAVSAGR